MFVYVLLIIYGIDQKWKADYNHILHVTTYLVISFFFLSFCLSFFPALALYVASYLLFPLIQYFFLYAFVIFSLFFPSVFIELAADVCCMRSDHSLVSCIFRPISSVNTHGPWHKNYNFPAPRVDLCDVGDNYYLQLSFGVLSTYWHAADAIECKAIKKLKTLTPSLVVHPYEACTIWGGLFLSGVWGFACFLSEYRTY